MTAAKYIWRNLVLAYYDFFEFKELHDSTQRARRRVIEQFLPQIARDDIRKFRPADVIELIDQKANKGTPEAARTRLNAIRAVLDYAERCDLVPTNVARDAKVSKVAHRLKRNLNGHMPWERADIEKYFTRWRLGTKEHLMLSILLYTGCRISDAAILGPVHEKDGWLTWREIKGRDLWHKPPTQVPISPALRESIDAAATGDLVYMVNAYDLPFKNAKVLGGWFHKSCIKAGIRAGLSAHGVRKAGATMAADAGATEYELMAMFGWSSPKQAAHYTRNVNRARLAGRAATRIAEEISIIF